MADKNSFVMPYLKKTPAPCSLLHLLCTLILETWTSYFIKSYYIILENEPWLIFSVLPTKKIWYSPLTSA